MHANAGAPSSEQVTLVGEPLVDHANDADDAVVVAEGVDVSVTVGAPAVLVLVTVQPYVALADPAVFATRTTKRCVPAARPAYVRGELQVAAAPPSSEHVTLVGEPLVDQANEADVDDVESGGPDVSATVGAVTVGTGGVVAESRSVPKS